MTKGSLVTHLQIQHGVVKGGLGSEGGKADGSDGCNKPRTYRMEFPAREGPRPCPFEGCSGRALTWTEIMVHFWNRHVRYTVVILEEGNLPHPWFPLCDMLVPWKSLNWTHRHTAKFNRGVERKRHRLAVEEDRDVTARYFRSHWQPLDMVTSFRNMVRVILAEDDD